jgi:hypothetical protein
MPDLADRKIDHPTVEHVLKLLEARLEAVATYGAGGCPTCHDAELRGAILLLRRLAIRGDPGTATALATSSTRSRRR